MAQDEDRIGIDKWMQVIDYLFDFAKEKEISELDFNNRPFKWESTSNTRRWICQDGPNRGVVYLSDHKPYWYASVQFQGRYWKSKHDFTELQEAVEWVEEELAILRNKSDEIDSRMKTDEEIKEDRDRIRQRLTTSPFRIDPSQLDTDQITYQVIIDVFYPPNDYKVGETVFGEPYHYDERYLSPIKLAIQLNLDPDQFRIEQPLGDNSGWCQFSSLVNYYQDTLAVAQAQLIWDKSSIVQHFKSGKVIRARYGYQEVETGYLSYLGGCNAPEQPWGKPPTRAEYMADKAIRHTIFYSMNVNDFRDYLGITAEIIGDERVIATMHEARAESQYIPVEARKESQIWLLEHDRANNHPIKRGKELKK